MQIKMERKYGDLRRQSEWKGARTNGKVERGRKRRHGKREKMANSASWFVLSSNILRFQEKNDELKTSGCNDQQTSFCLSISSKKSHFLVRSTTMSFSPKVRPKMKIGLSLLYVLILNKYILWFTEFEFKSVKLARHGLNCFLFLKMF